MPSTFDQMNINDNGFTLVEVLVALFIFAILTSASTLMLTGSLNSKTAVNEQSKALTSLQLARATIKADMLQVTIRPRRTEFGDQPNLGFEGGLIFTDQPFLSFMRRGAINPFGAAQRGNSQSVRYLVRGGKLIREVSSRSDPTTSTPKTERVLLSGINALNIQFLVNGVWVNEWRAATYDAERLPSAVALTLDINDYGPVRQLFALSGARP